ncbi:hypothetical protein RND15_50670, partial [Streptomyces sp. DSM 41529]|nr:hypothetical protein [Streptomyces sp. DSM 41529]
MTTTDTPPVAVGDPPAPPESQHSRRAPSVWPHRLVRLASVVGAVVLWQLLTANDVRLGLRFDTLPTVTEITAALVNRLGTPEYWLDLGQSLIRILTGFGIAAVVGVITGILLGRTAW